MKSGTLLADPAADGGKPVPISRTTEPGSDREVRVS